MRTKTSNSKIRRSKTVKSLAKMTLVRERKARKKIFKACGTCTSLLASGNQLCLLYSKLF